ncbi:MAG TPA: hypothetical protein VN999_16685, partial [Thermoanaerobaculia bacterium]|nr:hypothetical protein [Thermoanaerobaculia bacterium]
ILVAIRTYLWPWLSALMKRRSIERQEGARLIPTDGIERAMQFFIEPLFMDVDPAGEDDLRGVVGAQQKLFEVLDQRLRHPGKQRYLMLLADSGMGKTSALVNYYARHLRRWRRSFDLVMVPLGDKRCDQVIAGVGAKARTSIFLDALDEDPRAIANLRERLDGLLEATLDFRTVLISCRTQFFAADIEMPRETGILRVDPTPAGDDKKYMFYKMYLAPFNQRQIDKYLRRRYPFWRRRRRQAARRLMASLADLIARPLLLSYVDDILAANSAVSSLGDVYHVIVDAWLQREAAFVDSDHLLQFSKRLAVDLVAKRAERVGEKIPGSELLELASEWSIPLEKWQLGGRSLLNRDAAGNFKFAHRSIMEYLFAVRATEMDGACFRVQWTDLINRFAREFLGIDGRGLGRHQFDFSKVTDRQVAEGLLNHLVVALRQSADVFEVLVADASAALLLTELAGFGDIPRSYRFLVSLLCYESGLEVLLIAGVLYSPQLIVMESMLPGRYIMPLEKNNRIMALFVATPMHIEQLERYIHIGNLLWDEDQVTFALRALRRELSGAERAYWKNSGGSGV